jgi:hypothetical protein
MGGPEGSLAGVINYTAHAGAPLMRGCCSCRVEIFAGGATRLRCPRLSVKWGYGRGLAEAMHELASRRETFLAGPTFASQSLFASFKTYDRTCTLNRS